MLCGYLDGQAWFGPFRCLSIFGVDEERRLLAVGTKIRFIPFHVQIVTHLEGPRKGVENNFLLPSMTKSR